MRSSASAAVEDGTDHSTFLPFSTLRPPLGSDTTFQRKVASSSFIASAVKTWVPSDRSGCSKVTGTSNTGSKPLRTNSLPSLRLTNTLIGPGLRGRTSATEDASRGAAGAKAAAPGTAGLPASDAVAFCPAS